MPNPMDMSAGGFVRDGYPVDEDTWKDVGTVEQKTETQPESLVEEKTGDAFTEWAKSKGINISDDTKDILMQWYANENEQKSAWEKTLEYDNTKYQRAVQDMKKAGLNPFLLLSNGTSSPNLSAANVSGGSYAARKNASMQTGAQVAGSVMSMIGAIIAGVLIAMA